MSSAASRVDSGIGRSAYIMTSGGTSTRQHTTGPRQLENTYRLEPDEKFPIQKVRNIIKDVFSRKLNNTSYASTECNPLASNISELIKARVKTLGIDRYKIVCVVTLGQVDSSSISYTSRCIWNEALDTFVEYNFKNKEFYAVGLVYGVYLD